MRGRRGFTLIELLVVLAIMAVLAAMLMAGIQKARAAANRINCASQLRQIGSVMQQYNDATGTLPRARFCPDASGGSNPECKSIQPDDYTGPNETWWAPFDNRPGFSMTHGAGDENYQHGPLWPYLEQNRKIYQCPDGFDMNPTSPTLGQRYQVSYAMNYVTGGPSGMSMIEIVNGNGSANVMLAWDHTNSPACSTLGWPRVPVQPYIQPDSPHYPLRHGGVYNVLYCDGHITAQKQTDLQDRLFMMH